MAGGSYFEKKMTLHIVFCCSGTKFEQICLHFKFSNKRLALKEHLGNHITLYFAAKFSPWQNIDKGPLFK